MTALLMRVILRGIAIAIAVAALVDPALSIERATPAPLVLVKMTVEDVAPLERELRRMNPDADVQVREVVGHRLPCRPGDRCVVIADGSVAAEMPDDLDRPLSLIRMSEPAGPNVRLRSVMLASGQQASAAGAARVVLDGRGVAGQRTEIRVADTAAIVGSAVVEWKSDGVQSIDVPWWPLAPGPRTLRVEAMPTGGESALYDNALAAGVDVGAERLPVLVFDARSSWGSTFVRRALEDDARFLVEHRARLAPAITAGTANGRLDVRALDATAVLIVGGPDALTANEVDLIERFVRVRGGTLILLPERAPSGHVARLFAGEWSERLIAEPRQVGSLKATELLVYPPKGGHHRDMVILAAADAPVIVATPAGAGRIVVSGAMDAWRYRDDDAGAFDRFWRSVVAEGAAAGAPLRLEFDNAIGAPGSRQTFTVRYRAMTLASTIEANAVARCDPPSRPSGDGPPSQPSGGGPPSRPSAASADRAETIRLWPAGSPAVLRGELPMAGSSGCTVEVTVNDRRVIGGMAVSSARSRPAENTLAQLERQARASGGVVIGLRPSGATAQQAVAELVQPTGTEAVAADVHPMRSVWWLWPFVGCLSAEWWLRRRTGSA